MNRQGRQGRMTLVKFGMARTAIAGGLGFKPLVDWDELSKSGDEEMTKPE